MVFDINENKIIYKIDNINISCFNLDCLLKISKDLLLIAGKNKISIINTNYYKLIKIIDASGSGDINTTLMLNNNMLLTGDDNKRIIYWKIEDDNLVLISKKENAHNSGIYTLLKIGNDLILSGSQDKKNKKKKKS